MEFSQKWKNVLEFSFENEKKAITRSYSDEWNQSRNRSYLAECNYFFGVDLFRKGDIQEFKQKLHNSALIYEYCFFKYKNVWPYWNVKPYAYALLSENLNLIDQFLSLEIQESEMKDNPVYFNNGIKGLLTNNTLLIKKSIDILDYRILKKKEIRWSRVQKKCVEALANMDEQLLLDALSEFEDARIKKKQAIEADICENFISFFPIIYAKIAWMKGMEIDPGSKFMPIDLLKIEPLKEYTIPYWFLRDYYREQGINWRYDPLHPKLQDWENDPENPERNKGGFFKKLLG